MLDQNRKAGTCFAGTLQSHDTPKINSRTKNHWHGGMAGLPAGWQAKACPTISMTFRGAKAHPGDQIVQMEGAKEQREGAHLHDDAQGADQVEFEPADRERRH